MWVPPFVRAEIYSLSGSVGLGMTIQKGLDETEWGGTVEKETR
jgi:hypothetical protein